MCWLLVGVSSFRTRTDRSALVERTATANVVHIEHTHSHRPLFVTHTHTHIHTHSHTCTPARLSGEHFTHHHRRRRRHRHPLLCWPRARSFAYLYLCVTNAHETLFVCATKNTANEHIAVFAQIFDTNVRVCVLRAFAAVADDDDDDPSLCSARDRIRVAAAPGWISFERRLPTDSDVYTLFIIRVLFNTLFRFSHQSSTESRDIRFHRNVCKVFECQAIMCK